MMSHAKKLAYQIGEQCFTKLFEKLHWHDFGGGHDVKVI